MRIALLTKNYSLHRGGAEYDAVRMACSLLDRGHTVDLFTAALDGTPDPRLTVHLVKYWGWWSPLKIWTYCNNFARAVDRCEHQFDVVLTITQITWPTDIYWCGGELQHLWLPLRHKSWPWWRLGFISPRHSLNYWIEKQIMKTGNYRHVVSLSHMLDEAILKHFGVPRERYHVIPNGLDLKRFNSMVRPEWREKMRQKILGETDRPVLLFVGNDGKRKGLDRILAALGQATSDFPDYLFVVVGQIDQHHWRQKAENLGVPLERVRFFGRETNIERYYAAADLLVLPSRMDTFANVIPEAMACGCPVLSCNTVGASELIDPGRNGWMVDNPDNPVEFAAQLAELLSCGQMASAGDLAAAGMADFSWENTMDQLESVCQQVVEEKQRDR